MKAKPEYERNLKDYSTNYLGPFEEFQLRFRRRKVLEFLSHYSPKIILEVGCGKNSIVNYLSQKSFDKFIIVEPITSFIEEAVQVKSEKIQCFNCLIEQFSESGIEFDFIIISSLLHEVIDPQKILKSIHGLASNNTIIHLNVPNARSFHRLIALEMQMINSVFEQSACQIQLQQTNIFDMESLISLVESSDFEVINKGSFFIKPFTHVQMQRMIDEKIIDMNILEGLYKMIKYLPNMGSEIFINIRKKNN